MISEILAHGHYAQLLLDFCILSQSIMVDSLWLSKVSDIRVARWYRLRWRDWGPGIFLHNKPLVTYFLQLSFTA